MNNQVFIQQHFTKSIPEIALLLSKHPELDKEFILSQINGLQKAKKKLPIFFQNKEIVYPSSLSMEQCSSEETAIFKSQLIKGHSLIDLTGGFGVDSYYFSKLFKNVTYLEPNQNLFNVVRTNFNILNASNINCINSTTEDYLKANTQHFDVAYIDPSRRSEHQKVFILEDCVPNIVELKDEIFTMASQILVKTSPILDIKQSLKELKNVSMVWVVSVNNECKEVLYLIHQKATLPPKINTLNILHGGKGVLQAYSFDFETEGSCSPPFSEPLNYLYEPNTSILKAGAFKSIALQYQLHKLASNTHLYTSHELVADFPGRCFEIKNILPYQPKQFKKLGIQKANVSCRNFPETVAQVKKKLHLQDGGKDYLFATSDVNDKPILIVCVKVN